MIIKVYYLIPVYNCEQTIERCLKSINSNKYYIKAILINDKSTDNTLKVIESIKSKLTYEIVVINNKKNLGISSSLNIGIEYALKNKADYIIRLDGDDFNCKNRTDFQVDYMELNPRIMLSTCNAYLIEKNNIKKNIINSIKPIWEEFFKPYTSLIASLDIHPTFIFRIEPFKKYKIRYGKIPGKFLNNKDNKFIKSGVEDLLIINLIIYFYGYKSVIRLSDKKLIYYSVSNKGLTPNNKKELDKFLDLIMFCSFKLYGEDFPTNIKFVNIYNLSKKITKRIFKLNTLSSIFLSSIGSIIIYSRYYKNISLVFSLPLLFIISPKIFFQKCKDIFK